jgi:CDP-diacylglycerol--serine O-phosphatidyltransferase
VGKRVPPEMVLPVFVVVVLFFALLISYPWEVLTLGAVVYLVCLPLGWLSYRNYQRQDDAAFAAAGTAAGPASDTPLSPDHAGLDQDGDPGRPARLN